MNLGYARVSTDDQDTASQLAKLEAVKVDRIYQDTGSGLGARPELEKALEALEQGDTLTVYRFDRLARSLPDLLRVVQIIEDKKAHLVSLSEKIDTSTSMGRVMFHIIGAFAQFERDIISERTRAGLESARKAGRIGGRPRALTVKQIDHAIMLIDQQGELAKDVARSLRVSASTLRGAIKRRRDELAERV